jgi:hypothetical protein
MLATGLNVLPWVWRVVARTPALGAWLLKRHFTRRVCQNGLLMQVRQARFEIKNVRPMPALAAVELSFNNHLPFAIDIELNRITVMISSVQFMDFPLTRTFRVPSSGEYTLILSDIVLVERQVTWLNQQRRSDISITMRISAINRPLFRQVSEWDQDWSSDCIAIINGDVPP